MLNPTAFKFSFSFTFSFTYSTSFSFTFYFHFYICPSAVFCRIIDGARNDIDSSQYFMGNVRRSLKLSILPWITPIAEPTDDKNVVSDHFTDCVTLVIISQCYSHQQVTGLLHAYISCKLKKKKKVKRRG